jgi:signal transduction histidine kinase
MKNLDQLEKRAWAVFALIFILLASGIAAVGYISYRNFEKSFHAQAEQQLTSIAKLKVYELSGWRKERLGDAEILCKNPVFAALVKGWFENPGDALARARIQAWLENYQVYLEYDRVRLLDAEGQIRLSDPIGLPPVSSAVASRIPEVLKSKHVEMVDFYRSDKDLHIGLSIIIPIVDAQADNQAIGLVVLRIDPKKHIYPFIQSWPTPSASAETLLVRRDEGHVMFLNEFRFQRDAALALRISLEKVDTPAVKAVLGHEGIVEGPDYRGVPVVADVRPVPDSPWFLVSKVDSAEVSAPLRERLWQTLLFLGALLLAAGSLLAQVWRRQSLRHYRSMVLEAEALRESEVRYNSELEAKNAELERFTYTVSHDLKSPLVTIKGFLGYLEKDALLGNKDRLHEDIERIRGAAMKMSALLEELLEMSRIGRTVNPPEKISLGTLAREAAELVAGQIMEKKVAVDISPGLPEVIVDRPRMLEVLQNLLDNAVKYMGDQSEPRIEVGTREDNGETVFYVKDNGMGIEPRYQQRVFNLFDKLNPGSPGSGIGLALLKRIVEVHGGRIWVESEGIGKGSCFCFTIEKAKE